jgi:hypothetical protein
MRQTKENVSELVREHRSQVRRLGRSPVDRVGVEVQVRVHDLKRAGQLDVAELGDRGLTRSVSESGPAARHHDDGREAVEL